MATTIEELKEFFKGDRYATEGLGAVIEDASYGFSRCTMEIQPCHCNGLGMLMGGAVFTLADFAFAVASNQDGRAVVTQASQITFLKPAKGKKLIAEARMRKDGKKSCFYEVNVSDDLGNDVSLVTVNGFVVKNP